jgi:hypothetical protein
MGNVFSPFTLQSELNWPACSAVCSGSFVQWQYFFTYLRNARFYLNNLVTLTTGKCAYLLILVKHFFRQYCSGKHWANIRMNDHLEVKFAKQHKYWFYLVPILDVRGILATVCQYRPMSGFCQYCQYSNSANIGRYKFLIRLPILAEF